ncbi:Fungal Zn2-Cys6 binuclear cluster domain-containing protein [Cladophialophora immunda]|nr:Fungal Zn2-Cys6 binuclear cluster domain-containing protein [Cladophialophora immunda]
MTPTPPSANSSHSGASPDQFRVVRKRNRIPLSCAPCRHRKLKCNRQSPCDNCTKRGDTASCTYAAPAARKKGSQSQNAANATPDDMQNRIDRLEGLVLSLMTNGSQAAGPAAAAQALSAGSSTMESGSLGPNLDNELEESAMMDDADGQEPESETDGVTKSFGILKVDAEKQKTFYIGEAHWAALLNEIGEVRNYFVAHKKEYEAQMEKVEQARKSMGADVGSGPALLFGSTIPPSRAEILAQIPSRYMSDILIGRYFNTFDPATHILHGPTFQRHYNQHWADPSKSSIVWVAMLFSMMRLAMLSYGREGDEPPEFRGKCQDLAANFRTQMAHCLITADYTKPHNYIIETLIFHLHAEYTSNRDAEASVWVLVGMIARLAMRMGYHRDAKLFPNLSPFQGEMRRRVWTFVRSADLLFSFQVALPSMIRIGDSDTELPRNIYDDEFDEDSASLPPARPASEATPISYMIAKGRLSFGFGRVLEEINGVNRKGYDEVLKIDRGLRDIYESIPDHLKLRPMAEQTLAPISLIMARFSLATVYHKSQCVLHRRYMRLARNGNRYTHSRKQCLDSAMQLLSFQAIQHQQSRERGRLRSLRNHVNSLTAHDYLLAATIVCMDLYNHRERPDGNNNDVSTPNTSVSGGSISQGSNMSSDGAYAPGLSYNREDLIHALEESRDLPFLPSNPQNSQLPGASQQPQGSNNDEQNAAMTLGMLQAGAIGSSGQNGGISQAASPGGSWEKGGLYPNFGTNGEQFNTGIFGAANATSPFPSGWFGGAMGNLDQGMNLDWEAWDQYMQPSNLTLDPAASLWSNNSPNNNLFTQTSSPENTSTDATFGMSTGSSFYPQTIGSMMSGSTPDLTKAEGSGQTQQMPNLSATSTTSANNDNSAAGEVFMGVQSPQVASWKWTVMSDKK